MSKRLLIIASSAAVALMSATTVFAQSPGVTTPGDARMKNQPSADAMSAQESPAMRNSGKVNHPGMRGMKTKHHAKRHHTTHKAM